MRLSFRAGVLAASVCAAASAWPQHNLQEAQRDWPDLRLLSPSQVRSLGPGLRGDLERRKCRIPLFTRWDGKHNVIQGAFAEPGRQDVAVLCVAGDDASIVVYWGGAPDKAEELRKFPADAYRMIHTVTPFVLNKRAIRDQAQDRLPAFDHDAIEDGAVGGGPSETIYYHAGGWLDVF
jgi:hypothetical protein